ncbi:MAG TPA: DUF1861 family protein [Clostridiaceae bacterium]
MINKIKTCTELLIEFDGKKQIMLAEKLNFLGIQGRDVYNITKPFQDEEDTIIAGRVEERTSEVSEINFFKEIDGNWVRMERVTKLPLQDPFVTKIGGELILGGVEIYPHPLLNGYLGYRTIFYRGENVNSLEKFAVGPELMKDIRLLELSPGRILVFARHQGAIGGRGKIAYTVINSLEELNSQVITDTELLPNQFVEEEWGGPNELHLLKNGLIGVLGHVSFYDEIMERHYFAMAFSFNLETKEVSSIKIIATRKNFMPGHFKRKDIRDVIFSGGINRLTDGMAEFYAGVSDAEAHKILIEDPFLEYEIINK